MKKILFTIRIVIFVSLICIIIIGCSKVDKSVNTVNSAPLNNGSIENNTSRSSVTDTITPTQSSNSPLTPTSNPTISPAISPSLSDESFSQESVEAQLTTTQAPTSQTNLKASGAAIIAADYDDTGALYFITYDYDATDFIVSAYESQQGPGNYSGGGALYLINKTTGKVNAKADIDINKVNFSNYLTVYSKLSSKVIE